LTSIGFFFYDTGMLKHLVTLSRNNLRAILRDRVLYAVLAVAFLMLLLVPSMSTFSMRQVQELAISISLSASSFVLLIVSLLLGSSAIWKDVERRYLASVLTLPVSRVNYLLAKFISISLFLVACAVILGLVAAIVVMIAATQYPSDKPVTWSLFALALAGDTVKFILLSSIAILLSSVSTSFFLPFFGTIAIYLTGNASQEVYEFVSGQAGEALSATTLAVAKGAYYLLPNLAAFDFKVPAVYALDVSMVSILYPLGYSIVYIGLVLSLASWAFNRRQLS
jgi:ABC-type transport system involved in multi-copper enzyme maturation permease subunit